jgi:nucleosome binding factor SPN SPT16 subunit
LKDFTRPPLHIDSIQTAQLDDVKSWLEYVDCRRDEKITDPELCSSVDIPLSTGPVNLNWGPIMKTMNESPYDFFQQAGGVSLEVPMAGKTYDLPSPTVITDSIDESEGSDSESEFEADPEDFEESESSAEDNDEQSGSDLDDSGSGGAASAWSTRIPCAILPLALLTLSPVCRSNFRPLCGRKVCPDCGYC